MKTYHLLSAILVLSIISCSKSESTAPASVENNVDAEYTVLLTANETLSSSSLNANLESLTLNPSAENSLLNAVDGPLLSYRDNNALTLYSKEGDCSRIIRQLDFEGEEVNVLSVFNDKQDCDLSVRAIARSGSTVYLGYSVPNDVARTMEHYLRIVAPEINAAGFLDLGLESEPLQIIFSNSNLFILYVDTMTDKNKLMVMDTTTNEFLHEIDLGFNVQKLVKNAAGDILCSYAELHTIIDSATFATIATVRYLEGTEPKFGYTPFSYLDASGMLFYPMKTAAGSEYPTIPARYDFSTNTTTLFLYERFLSEEQRRFEFQIEDTSVVALDAENDILLIGYKKTGTSGKGGLLRVKLGESPRFLDHIDFDGIPYDIHVK